MWLTAHRPELREDSAQTEQRFQIGFQVGDVARSLHPDGLLIDTPAPGEALALARRALVEQPERPLFEAAFQCDGVLVRADLLLPESGGYRLREGKASTRVKDEHWEDCARPGLRRARHWRRWRGQRCLAGTVPPGHVPRTARGTAGGAGRLLRARYAGPGALGGVFGE